MKLIPAAWRALLDAGVDVIPIDAWHVELRHGQHRERLLLRTSSRPLNPSDVAAIVNRTREAGLLLVPAATAAARRVAERADWSWLVVGDDGVRGVLRFGEDAINVGEQGSAEGLPERGRPGRVPWGSLTVVRRLLESPAVTQKALAALANVSQPRVSQTLSDLVDQQLVMRGDAGWMVRDFDRLLRLWLDTYPGHGGIASFWYGLESPREQAQAVIRRLSETLSEAVVSGDVAADIIAPWRSPSRAVIYARRGADLTDLGLTPAGAEEATLELIVPQDPGVWPLPSPPASRRDGLSMPIADPIQVLWDVERLPGPDRGEAVARLWELLRERSLPRS